ncbi:hypothetical protein PR048_015912 [Dryococelus australis]|uniref:Uncharacterized protein n=1 Tax=Dryococelus australis TaxID=614101 RepID=A0ABQ9HI88_9NEOP|nr:hypothetical protein PR048_015912 [Dryococelus australis]
MWMTLLCQVGLFETVTTVEVASNNKVYRTVATWLCVCSVSVKGDITYSKSQFAPVELIILLQLELCGAVLLVGLLNKTLPTLELDSIWMVSPATIWKPFVVNRVVLIVLSTQGSKW